MSKTFGRGGVIHGTPKSKNAFTLVELMIVIAIISILAAALFPSMSRYLMRSRDAARVSDLHNIQVAIGAYEIDTESLPLGDIVTPGLGGCYPHLSLSGQYLQKIYQSPSGVMYDEGCGQNGRYGYGASTGETILPRAYLLMAQMENLLGGNYSGSTQGMTGTLTPLGNWYATMNTVKGTGSIYILSSMGGGVVSAGGGSNGSTSPPASMIPTHGVCNTSAVGCSAGTLGSLSAGSCGGTSTWVCNGTNGGNLANCSTPNPACTPVNGVCGSASGSIVSSPPTSGLCADSSTPSVSTTATGYLWTCAGQYGGSSLTCRAMTVYGQCTAAGQTYTRTGSRAPAYIINEGSLSQTIPPCNMDDLIVCNGVGVGQTWQLCNVGATVAGYGLTSPSNVTTFGYTFNWGRNLPAPYTGSVECGTVYRSRGTWGMSLSSYMDDKAIFSNFNDADKSKMQGPCAPGYHVPTYAEFGTKLGNSLSSVLKFPSTNILNNSMFYHTSIGVSCGSNYYATSGSVPALSISAGGINTNQNIGAPVRCIKND